MATLTDVQRSLLAILGSVEGGNITPEQATKKLELLKAEAAAAGLTFRAEYSTEDFERIRNAYLATYETSTDYVEPSYETSDSY